MTRLLFVLIALPALPAGSGGAVQPPPSPPGQSVLTSYDAELASLLEGGSSFLAGIPILDYEQEMEAEQISDTFGKPGEILEHEAVRRQRELRDVAEIVLVECRVAGQISEPDADVATRLVRMLGSPTAYWRTYGTFIPKGSRDSWAGRVYTALRVLQLSTELNEVGGHRTKKGKALVESFNTAGLSTETAVRESVYLVELYRHIAANCGDEDITELPAPSSSAVRLRD